MFRGAPELPGELFQLALRIADEDRIIAFTSDSMDAASGFHHPRLLIVITEAQGVEDGAFEAALSCTTATTNRLLVLGNPLRNAGAFYRFGNSDAWHCIRIPASDHPNVTEGREVIPGGVTREWCEYMASEYGRDSSVYRARVDAHWPTESIESLVARAWIDEAFRLHREGALEDAARTEPVRFVLDVAGPGRDRNVLAHVQGPILRHFDVWRDPDTMRSVERVLQRMSDHGRAYQNALRAPRFRLPDLVLDVGGLGHPIADRFDEKSRTTHLDIPVERFNGANQARDPRRYTNARAEAYFAVRHALERGQVALPSDEELAEELLATEWVLDERSGRVMLLKKDDIKARIGGRSPDKADVVAMAVYTAGGGTRTVRFGVV